MLQIIEIERKGSIWTLRFEHAPPLRCSRAFARRLNIQAGQQIDPVVLERMRQTAAADLAEQLAERLLRRPRSRREIAARLRQEGVPDEAARAALEQLEEQGEHDELEDALILARQCASRGDTDWSAVRQRCGQRLRRRGFSAATAMRAVQLAWQETQQEARQETRQDRPEPLSRDLSGLSDLSDLGDAQIEPIASAKFRSPVP